MTNRGACTPRMMTLTNVRGAQKSRRMGGDVDVDDDDDGADVDGLKLSKPKTRPYHTQDENYLKAATTSKAHLLAH